jgi:hypothetical protein
MKELIRNIIQEETDGLRERFIRSAKSIPYIIESNTNSNLFTNVEIENIYYGGNEISGELLITSWCEDPDLFSFTDQLKLVDKELDKVLLNYSFTSKGSFGKKKGKYNNLMCWFVGCEWNAGGDYSMNMKYHFTQEEFDDGE